MRNQGRATLINTTVRNSATGGAFAGGGLANDATAVLLLQDSLMQGNRENDGGGIYAAGTVTLVNSTVRNNVATNKAETFLGGGGIFVADKANLTVQDSQILRNFAFSGGGILNDRGIVKVSRSTFQGPVAKEEGGAICSRGLLSRIILDGTTLSLDRARRGGGIFSSYGNATLDNSTLSGNSADDYGGGLENHNGVATLTNVTLSGNSAGNSGGGIRHSGQQAAEKVTLKNTIVVDSPTGSECHVWVDSVTSIASLGHNLDDDNSCNLTEIGDQPGVNDPKLGPLADNGGPTRTHVPLAGSPAVEGGQCVGGIATDQRGIARPQGAACDIGAVEAREAEHMVFVPLIVR